MSELNNKIQTFDEQGELYQDRDIVHALGCILKAENIVYMPAVQLDDPLLHKDITVCVDGGTGIQDAKQSLKTLEAKISLFGGYAGVVLGAYRAWVKGDAIDQKKDLFQRFLDTELQGSYIHSCNHYHNPDTKEPVDHVPEELKGCPIGCGHVQKNIINWLHEDKGGAKEYMTKILHMEEDGSFTFSDDFPEKCLEILLRDHKELAIVLNISKPVLIDSEQYFPVLKSNRVFVDDKEYQVFEYDVNALESILEAFVATFGTYLQKVKPDLKPLSYDALKEQIEQEVKLTLKKLINANQLITNDKVFTLEIDAQSSCVLNQTAMLKELIK